MCDRKIYGRPIIQKRAYTVFNFVIKIETKIVMKCEKKIRNLLQNNVSYLETDFLKKVNALVLA